MYEINLIHCHVSYDIKYLQLPIEDLVKHVNLRLLDLRNNRLTKYSPEFTELVKQPGGKGLDIKYKGIYQIIDTMLHRCILVNVFFQAIFNLFNIFISQETPSNVIVDYVPLAIGQNLLEELKERHLRGMKHCVLLQNFLKKCQLDQ